MVGISSKAFLKGVNFNFITLFPFIVSKLEKLQDQAKQIQGSPFSWRELANIPIFQERKLNFK